MCVCDKGRQYDSVECGEFSRGWGVCVWRVVIKSINRYALTDNQT